MRTHISIIFCLVVLAECDEEGPDVVHGFNTKLSERPFQVSIQLRKQHFCGGSIISPYYVLTVAQYEKTLKSHIELASVAAGMVDVRKPGQRHDVKKFISHEKYVDLSLHDDIGLVQLKTPFTFNSHVQPIRLASRTLEVPPNSAVILSGWGNLGLPSNKFPKILQTVALQTVDQKKCKEMIEEEEYELFDTNLCAYDSNEPRGMCTGDAGGPLTFGRVQVGIISWSIECGSAIIPQVYTRVSSYIDWIEKHSNLNITALNMQ